MVGIPASDVERRFHVAMLSIYESAARDCDYRATRFLEMVHRLGGLQAAKRLLASEEFSLLTQSNEVGLQCVNLLNDLGVRVAHTFGVDGRSQQASKRSFYMGAEKVKASTIYSFKGWESRALVIAIGQAKARSDRQAVFVALSRLKQEVDRGSFLTVVCSVPELAAFGQSFHATQ